MIKHYLKVALRNLLKYKTHSLISGLCLAIGIVCFSFMTLFIYGLNDGTSLPFNERRLSFTLYSDKTAADCYFSSEDVRRLEELHLPGVDNLAAHSFTQSAEIDILDKEQRATPYMIRYCCVNSFFFPYFGIQYLYGPRQPLMPDEVILSERFAKKIFGDKNPIGQTIHIVEASGRSDNLIKDFKITNVAADEPIWWKIKADCYFPLEMNPYWENLMVGSYLTEEVNLDQLNKMLPTISWQRRDATMKTWVSMKDKSSISQSLGKLFILFLSSLILISGLINFLKFIIQMFYNRQRELALRKCMGSDEKGLFLLFFAEVFWMMSFAFLLSLILTEIVYSLMNIYLPPDDAWEVTLHEIYTVQAGVYLLLIVTCLFIIRVPVRRLREVSISSGILLNRKKHLFRNIMIGLQLAISIFFVGGVMVVSMAWNELLYDKIYNPLTTQEEGQIISMSVNSRHMRDNMDAILSGINTIPEIAERTFVSYPFDLKNFIYINYKKPNQSDCPLLMLQGDPHYFDFFQIPYKGQIVEANASGTVYISDSFQKQLEKDGVKGMVELNGSNYRIAGTFKGLNKEFRKSSDMLGSVFIPSPEASLYYLKVASGYDTEEVVGKLADICRRFVPSTLALDIHPVNQKEQTTEGALDMIQSVLILLAIVSVLLVILSIYSAISMDTISRQKEVAIRKINGATPRDIALLFGKVYLYIYLIAFACIYPLLRLMVISLMDGAVGCVYNWDWGIALFFIIALLLFTVTAYKIKRIMHLDPATIIKTE